MVDSDESDSWPTFSEADEFSDLILVVEGKKLHVHRVILATASQVWRRMFLGDFQEKEAKEIPLPGKTYQEVIELLYCIYPSCRKRINSDTAIQLLALCEEYQLTRLKRECELTLSQQIGKSTAARKVLDYLVQAERYHLPRLLDKAITLAGRIALSTLEGLDGYKGLEHETQDLIFRRRIEHLESANKQLGDNVERVTKQLNDLQARELQEKRTIRDFVRQIRNTWGVQDSRGTCCTDHSVPPHQNCLLCNEAARKYVLNTCDTLFNQELSGVEWPSDDNGESGKKKDGTAQSGSSAASPSAAGVSH